MKVYFTYFFIYIYIKFTNITIILMFTQFYLNYFYFVKNLKFDFSLTTATFYFFCNDYISQLTYNFSNPKTGAMLGMIELHQYLMFFLIIILIYTIIFLFLSYKTAYYYNSKQFVNADYEDREEVKKVITYYINNKLNLSYYHYPVLEFI